VGDRVDLNPAMSDNAVVNEVEFVSVALRVLKRAQMPTPENVGALLERWRMYDSSQEQVWVLAFDTQGSLRKVSRVAQGSYDKVDVPIAAVMSAAHLAAADRFWLVHNHPGGSAIPSLADIDLTQKVMAAANISGLRMEDHVILAAGGDSYSFRQNGMIRAADEVEAAAANEMIVDPVAVEHRTDVLEAS